MFIKIISNINSLKVIQNVKYYGKYYNKNGYHICRSFSSKVSVDKVNKNEPDLRPRAFEVPKPGHTKFIQELIADFNEEITEGGVVPVFKKALVYADKIAIEDNLGFHSYATLYGASKRLSWKISQICASGSQARVVFLTENNSNYTVCQWACWISGQIAVPMSDKYPQAMLEYYINDCECSLLICSSKYEPIFSALSTKLNMELIVVEPSLIEDCPNKGLLDSKSENVLNFNNKIIIEGCQFGNFYNKADAMILYTSGSTGDPKGVLISYRSLQSQINCLAHAWQWHPSDCILHTLPLNHTHGIINGLLCALDCGAKVNMSPKFDPADVWAKLTIEPSNNKLSPNIFMGVPTMYSKLIEEFDNTFGKNKEKAASVKAHLIKNNRLMVSGSAPLLGSVSDRWFEITGHRLLERYGMTEIGMALSNPYIEDKSQKRMVGSVGLPLPGVQVRIVQDTEKEFKTVVQMSGKNDNGFWRGIPTNILNLFIREDHESAEIYSDDINRKMPIKREKPQSLEIFKNVTSQPSYTDMENVIDEIMDEDIIPTEPVEGDLLVRGSNVFRCYFNRPNETQKDFIMTDWFKTGDTASFENGVFKIKGRTNIDIIKTGGYKISALEIENVLAEHPDIVDCAVFGIPDEKWGQKICSMVVLGDGKKLDFEQLKLWAKEKLPDYGIPKEMIIEKEILRNLMGKVNKKEIVKRLTKS